MKSDLVAIYRQSFEGIASRHKGVECWSARDLQQSGAKISFCWRQQIDRKLKRRVEKQQKTLADGAERFLGT